LAHTYISAIACDITELPRTQEVSKKPNSVGETKIVMECTGAYHLPIAYALTEAELFVSTVNPIITHNYDNNSIHKSRNDKSDAIKIANYTLTNWLKLPRFIPEEDVRHMLKAYSRQYTKYKKILTMLKNNLISLLDSTFPGSCIK
jgi:transposase